MYTAKTYNQIAKHTYDAAIRKDCAVRYREVRAAMKYKMNRVDLAGNVIMSTLIGTVAILVGVLIMAIWGN